MESSESTFWGALYYNGWSALSGRLLLLSSYYWAGAGTPALIYSEAVNGTYIALLYLQLVRYWERANAR